MRDLEIRGAGNLLGAEQSGHMEAVGYDMFVRLLEQAVLEEKGEAVKEMPECAVDLGISAFIPERYIKRPSGRIEMYKRISEIKNKSDADDVGRRAARPLWRDSEGNQKSACHCVHTRTCVGDRPCAY